MKHRRKKWGLDIVEVFLSFTIVISAILLVLSWKTREYLFLTAFGAAFLLFLIRGIRMSKAPNGHMMGVVMHLAGATCMFGFLTASALTMLGSNL